MRAIFAFLLVLFILPATGQLVINDPNAEVRNLSTFASVKASGGIDLIFTKGKSQAVVVSDPDAPDNSAIKTVVSNNVLLISSDIKGIRINRHKSMKVYISYTELTKITASGACNISFADPFAGEQLTTELSGASSFTGSVRASRAIFNLSGASDAKVSGAVQELSVSCTGASDFKAYALTALKCVAELSGASDVQITVTESIKATASGASEIFVKGNPAQSTVEKSGSSTIKFVN